MLALLIDLLPCHQYSEEKGSFHRGSHGDREESASRAWGDHMENRETSVHMAA